MLKGALSFLVIFAGCFTHELWIGHQVVPILLRTFGLTLALISAVYLIKLSTKYYEKKKAPNRQSFFGYREYQKIRKGH